MKKTIIIIMCLLISSCSIDWNDEKDIEVEKKNSQIKLLNDKISTLNKKIDEINNENKKDCLSHYESIQKDILNHNKKYGEQYSLMEVFYSKNQNECFFIVFSYIENFNIEYSMHQKLYKYWVNISAWDPIIGYNIWNSACTNKTKKCKEIVRKRELFDKKIIELKK